MGIFSFIRRDKHQEDNNSTRFGKDYEESEASNSQTAQVTTDELIDSILDAPMNAVDDATFKDLQQIKLISLISISPELRNRFPSITNTPEPYNSESIVLAGTVGYYGLLRMRQGNIHADFIIGIYDVVDRRLRARERELYRKDFIPYDFNSLTTHFLECTRPQMQSLNKRANDCGIEPHKILALDIAGWIVANLTKGKAIRREREECEMFFANFLINCIAFDMMGLNKS